MANWSDPRGTNLQSDYGNPNVGMRGDVVDGGLRKYMLSIYNMMGLGVLITGVVAWFAHQSGFTAMMFGSPIRWLVMLAPLAFVMVLSFGINRMSTATAQMVFWAYSVVMGLSMSVIFAVYTNTSIATTFVATAASFFGLSLYGYTTKRDLTGFGTFLIMGLIGLIVASLVNLFLQSSTMAFVISAIGVLLFAGLTAYDTQKLKSMYAYLQGSDFMGKAIVMGALTLYLDFINMFQFLLSFLGDRE